MADRFLCFRCGASLETLTLPFSRRDGCPQCAADVHVCRMCLHFDKSVPKQCHEDDAEEVFEKEKANFCEWFLPSTEVFDPERANQAHKAEQDLASLFGESSGTTQAEANDSLVQSAEDLFK